MAAVAFDTLRAARDLEAAGIARAHAEAIAETIGRADERVATRGDIERVESRIEQLEKTIEKKADKADIAALKWILAFQGALILAIAARLFGLV